MKIVLAYSGGLDTSYCCRFLADNPDNEVHALTINTGGFTPSEATKLRSEALRLGAAHFEMIDQTQSFYENGIKYLLFGNVLKNNTYPLSVSAERVFQALAIAEYANKIEADAIAHGSTGAGNDQIRFDMVFHTHCPDKTIITPIRDHSLSREEEVNFLKEKGIKIDFKKAHYSINQGIWGTSVGGKETLTSHLPLPENAFPSQLKRSTAQSIQIEFREGQPIALDEQEMRPLDLIVKLNKLASSYAIGRDIHVGDTIIGIKGRVGFEAAAPLILIKAHHALEKHTLSKQQLLLKDQLSIWYGNMMHEGQYLDPSMRDMEAFLRSSQQNVSGTVHVELLPYRFQILGIQSDYDLMQRSKNQYGEAAEGWTSDEARGFAKLLANSLKSASVEKKEPLL